ncbi:MAG: hypothetical protein HY370_04720 [Proteobacteria bacterium]|nr:hypothetical protein [Pseudomonadota bacterium]
MAEVDKRELAKFDIMLSRVGYAAGGISMLLACALIFSGVSVEERGEIAGNVVRNEIEVQQKPENKRIVNEFLSAGGMKEGAVMNFSASGQVTLKQENVAKRIQEKIDDRENVNRIWGGTIFSLSVLSLVLSGLIARRGKNTMKELGTETKNPVKPAPPV